MCMSYRRFVFLHSDFTFILILPFKSKLYFPDCFFYLFIAVSSGTFTVFNQYLQAGIEGICQTRYVIQDDSKNNRATISKSKDLTDCQDKAVRNLGMAHIRPCPTCPLVRAARSQRCPAGVRAPAQHPHSTDAPGGFGFSGQPIPGSEGISLHF